MARSVGIVQNHVAGTAAVGLWLGTESAESWDIVDNDLDDLTSDDVAVWLDAGASSVWVRGNAPVRDDGEDNRIDDPFPHVHHVPTLERPRGHRAGRARW